METKKYFALTVGPIFETLSQTKETRQLWAASYTFSYLIREAIVKLKARKFNVISPFLEENPLNNTGAGLYPDRIFCLQNDNQTLEDFQNCIIDTIKDFSLSVYDHLFKKSKVLNPNDDIFYYDANANNLTFENVFTQIKAYLKYYCVEVDLDEIDSNGRLNNILEPINKMLDTTELTAKIPNNTLPLYLNDFWFRVLDSFLVKDGFNVLDYYHFDSIFDISSRELYDEAQRKNPYSKELFYDFRKNHFKIVHKIEKQRKNRQIAVTEDDKKYVSEFLKQFKLKVLDQCNQDIQDEKEKLKLKPYHKYFAVVYADGDNVGSSIGSLVSEHNIMQFSKELHNFSKSAALLIKNYGGLPIFIGADDMLFFAPIANLESKTNSKHIIKLIDELDQLFIPHKEALVEIKEEDNKLKQLTKEESEIPINFSISYGMAITYFKFPLYESMKTAYYNLTSKAKNKSNFKNKNALQFTMQKHSGQKMDFGISKLKNTSKEDADTLYDIWIGFINKYTFQTGVDSKFLNSLTHKIDDLDNLFKASLKTPNGIINFFEKSFNEDVHKNNSFIKELGETCHKFYKCDSKNAKEMIFSMLRYIDFINKDKDDN